MAKNPQEVVFEGWLTKSPPTKRIWRAVSFDYSMVFTLIIIVSD